MATLLQVVQRVFHMDSQRACTDGQRIAVSAAVVARGGVVVSPAGACVVVAAAQVLSAAPALRAFSVSVLLFGQRVVAVMLVRGLCVWRIHWRMAMHSNRHLRDQS